MISGGVNRARGAAVTVARFDRGRALGASPPRRRLRQPPRPPGLRRSSRPRPARPALSAHPGSSEERQRQADALIDPALRNERDDDLRRAGGDRRAASVASARTSWSTRSSRTPPGRSPSCAGARSNSPARRSVQARWPACPVSSGYVCACPSRRRGEPPRRPGRLARQPGQHAHLALDRQSALALSFRPRHRRDAQRLRPQRCRSRPIPSCSTGWPSSSAITASRSRRSIG